MTFKYKTYTDGCYTAIDVPKEVFDKIPLDICISGTTESIKYLLGNKQETVLLQELGVDTDGFVDWYKVCLKLL